MIYTEKQIEYTVLLYKKVHKNQAVEELTSTYNKTIEEMKDILF